MIVTSTNIQLEILISDFFLILHYNKAIILTINYY